MCLSLTEITKSMPETGTFFFSHDNFYYKIDGTAELGLGKWQLKVVCVCKSWSSPTFFSTYLYTIQNCNFFAKNSCMDPLYLVLRIWCGRWWEPRTFFLGLMNTGNKISSMLRQYYRLWSFQIFQDVQSSQD